MHEHEMNKGEDSFQFKKKKKKKKCVKETHRQSVRDGGRAIPAKNFCKLPNQKGDGILNQIF